MADYLAQHPEGGIAARKESHLLLGDPAPRLAMFGVIGGPLAFASPTAVLFGAWDQTSGAAFILTVPEIVFEASFAIYLIVRGFSPSRVLSGQPAT